MTVVEHLSELRTRLIVALAVFVVISLGAFFFYPPMLEFLTRPLCSLPSSMLGDNGCRLFVFTPLEAFLFRLKMTALAGITLSSPIWLYEIYAFILPALTAREKRYSTPFLLSSMGLLLLGCAFAYLTLPTGLRFLLGLGGPRLQPLLSADRYLTFIGLMFLGFAATFELPLVLLFLGLAGAVNVQQLRRQRKVAFVSIFVIAAVVTPSQDPYTMSVLALPLYALYELTVVILARVERRRRTQARGA
jgi:sec-independent protein translocase protein TatC